MRNGLVIKGLIYLAASVAVLSCLSCKGSPQNVSEEVKVPKPWDDSIYSAGTVECDAFMRLTDPQPPACSSSLPMPAAAPRRTIRVVGADALNWRVVNLFLAQHELPNLQRMACSGARAILRTDFACSPISWTTIATGKRAAKHGIEPVNEPGRTAYDYSIEAIKVPRIWDMMRYFGLSAAIGRYYFTKEGLCNDIAMETQSNEMRQTFAAKNDFFITILTSTDPTQHFGIFPYLLAETEWGRHYRIEPRWAPLFAYRVDFLKTQFHKLDEVIGKLLADHPDDNIFLISDHGMHVKPSTIIVKLDLHQLFHDPKMLEAASLSQDEHYYPLAAGSEPGEKFFIKLILPRITLKITAPEDTATAEEAKKFLERAAIGHDSMFAAQPDGTFVLNPTLIQDLIERKRADRSLEITLSFGIHNETDHGVLLAYGPDIRPNTLAGPYDLVDVTPTLLYLAGLPVGRDMDGHVAEGIFRPELLASRPIEWTDSYDELIPVASVPGARRELTPEEIKRYRQIGYPGIP